MSRSIVTLCAFSVFGFVSAASATVFTSVGAAPADIQATVDSFRTTLGTLNANVVGSFGSGRREINWDGVPDALSAPNNLPANFFNSNSPRGVVFSGATGFQVSAKAASGTPVRFGNLNASYPAGTQTFSPERLFTALGSNIYTINFFVPGSSTPATVGGFGAVFTDVETFGGSAITIVHPDGSTARTNFPIGPSGGLSFLGVTDPARISQIIIQAGTATPGVNEVLTNDSDIVFQDDFIFGEPIAVPEPASLGLIGGFSLLARRKRN